MEGIEWTFGPRECAEAADCPMEFVFLARNSDHLFGGVDGLEDKVGGGDEIWDGFIRWLLGETAAHFVLAEMFNCFFAFLGDDFGFFLFPQGNRELLSLF